jgi:hypothetical protein
MRGGFAPGAELLAIECALALRPEGHRKLFAGFGAQLD